MKRRVSRQTKMHRMKRPIAFALSLFLAGAVLAQPGPRPHAGGPGGPGGPPPEHGQMFAAYLSLTAEQQTAWEAIQTAQRAATEGLFEQQRALQEQIEASTDATTIGTLVLQQRAIRTQVETAHETAMTQLKALLTPEQLTKLAALEQQPRRRGPLGPPPR